MSQQPGAGPNGGYGPEVRVVAAWHEALNSGDAERLVGLSHPDVEVVGPRGTGRGAQLLREWVARAGIHLEPGRVFHQGDVVVVEQEAQWRSADTGETSSRQTVACVFVVRDDVVLSVSRYPDLEDALRAAELDGSHEVGDDLQEVSRGPAGGEVEQP